MLLMPYRKLEWRVGVRTVARFLPPALGNLLVKFIVLVLHFARILRRALQQRWRQSSRASASNEAENDETDDNKMVVNDESEVDADICLPLLNDATRRLSVFGQSSDSPDADDDNDADDDEDDGDEDDETDSAMERNNLSHDAFLFSTDGRRPWDSCKLSAAIHHKMTYAFSVAIAIQAWRHLAIAIDRFYLQGISARAFGNPYDESAGIDNGAAEYNWHH